MKEKIELNQDDLFSVKCRQIFFVVLFFVVLSVGFSTVNAQTLSGADLLVEKKNSSKVSAKEVQKPIIDDVLDYARQFMGRPYRRGGKGPKIFDCSGFTSYVYKRFSYSLHPSPAGQYVQGESVKKADMRPGDLVFYKGRNASHSRVGHVGVVSEVLPNGQFKFIHASSNRGICVEKSTQSYYQKRFMGVRRIVNDDEKNK